MLFNYTTHFLVLYYFSSSSPTKVRGVREELKLFLFYFFISTFYISLKKIRMLEILSHSSHFFPFISWNSEESTKRNRVQRVKRGGKSEKHNRLFSISHRIFKSTHQLKQTSGNICYLWCAKDQKNQIWATWCVNFLLEYKPLKIYEGRISYCKDRSGI